jgi:hypothetical protein
VTSRISATGAASLSRGPQPVTADPANSHSKRVHRPERPRRSPYALRPGDVQVMSLAIFITDSAQDVCENAVKLLSARTRAVRPPATHNVRSRGRKIPQTKSQTKRGV